MAGIGSRHTRPEISLRNEMHARGFRFRLHRMGLPGSPDLIFPRYRAAVFVHGCFWHRHPGCQLAAIPKSRVEFWDAKFAANVSRDRRVELELLALGWRVGVVWECGIRRDSNSVGARLATWLLLGLTDPAFQACVISA
jgi:DNA mismatch endonuclease (patch repair protein)